MSVKVDGIIDMARDLIQGEPVIDLEDQDEYLNRLGVPDDIDDEKESIDISNRNPITAIDHANTAAMVHDRNYGFVPGEGVIYGDPRSSTINMTQEYIQWSNGDNEVRPRRRRLDSRIRRDIHPQHRAATSDYVHEAVKQGKLRIINTILGDVEHLLYTFLDEYSNDLPKGKRSICMLLESMVDHYLEDIGDDVIMRHQVRIRMTHDDFMPDCVIRVEMPNGLVREMSIPINFHFPLK